MPFRIVWLALLPVWVFALTGCATSTHEATADSRTASEAAMIARAESPEETDRQREAHARFMGAVTEELNGKLETAASGTEKAFNLDPSNEVLALDLPAALSP